MTKLDYVLYDTQDDEIHYYIQANNIKSAAKQAKDKYPGYAVAPYALTSVTEGRNGKIDFESYELTHVYAPEIYKFRSPHGGYRPGAGAKKTTPAGAKDILFWVTEPAKERSPILKMNCITNF